MNSSFSFRVFCLALGIGLMIAAGLVLKSRISFRSQSAEIEVVE